MNINEMQIRPPSRFLGLARTLQLPCLSSLHTWVCAVLCHLVLCFVVLCFVVLCCAVLCCAALHCTLLCCALLHVHVCRIALYYVVLHSVLIVLCCIWCIGVPCGTVLHWVILSLVSVLCPTHLQFSYFSCPTAPVTWTSYPQWQNFTFHKIVLVHLEHQKKADSFSCTAVQCTAWQCPFSTEIFNYTLESALQFIYLYVHISIYVPKKLTQEYKRCHMIKTDIMNLTMTSKECYSKYLMASWDITVQVTGEAAIPTSLRQKQDMLSRGYMIGEW